MMHRQSGRIALAAQESGRLNSRARHRLEAIDWISQPFPACFGRRMLTFRLARGRQIRWVGEATPLGSIQQLAASRLKGAKRVTCVETIRGNHVERRQSVFRSRLRTVFLLQGTYLEAKHQIDFARSAAIDWLGRARLHLAAAITGSDGMGLANAKAGQ